MDPSHQLQTALPHLSMFLAVARHRSFSAAARELGVSVSAVSQSVRQLEATLKMALLQRTTRAVTPTQAGQRLIETASGPVRLAMEAMQTASAQPGELTGTVKLLVAEAAIPLAVEPVLPVFRERYPQVSVEVVLADKVVDFVAAGFDATYEVPEVIARDLGRVRLAKPFKFYVVGAPSYFAKHGKPKTPEELLSHECIGFRWPIGDTLYPWELQRGRKKWRVPVRGHVVTNSYALSLAMAERGQGLMYVAELTVREQLKRKTLVTVLDAYSPTEEGIFLCYPNRSQRSEAFTKFVEVSKEVLLG